jgi:DivIVA domain-containing protein
MSGSSNGYRPTPEVEGVSGWRPMSPDEIRSAQLRETGLGRRGYRPEEVHQLLARVANEVARWSEAYAECHAEVRRLRNFYRNEGIDIDRRVERRPETADDAVSTRAIEMLAKAQAYADRVVADAQAQARNMQADARAQAENIVVHARREADAAGRAYRARSGSGYNPDREEVERLVAWTRSILATVKATQQQLAATGEAFTLELAKFSSPPRPEPPTSDFTWLPTSRPTEPPPPWP